MQRRSRFIAAALALAAVLSGTTLAAQAIGSDEPEPGDTAALAEEETGEGHDVFLDARQAPGEAIASGDLLAAGAEADAVEAQTARELPGLLNPEWSLAGPANVGGRVTDIAPDPTHPGQVYVGVSTAGVWKSTDGGVTLTNTWPNDLPQAIGAVTVAPNGDVWVGTGEVNPGGGSLSYGGDGLYRSTAPGAPPGY